MSNLGENGKGYWRRLGTEQDKEPWFARSGSASRPEEYFEFEELPFPPSQYEGQYEDLKKALSTFFDNHSDVDMRLSGETGLPHYLYGRLCPDGCQGDNNVSIAKAFLQENRLIITGSDAPVSFLKSQLDENDEDSEDHSDPDNLGITLRALRRTRWSDGTEQIRFGQYNRSGSPVYGARVVATFDAANQLAMLSNSLYPNSEKLPELPNSISPDAVIRALKAQIPDHIGFTSLEEGISSWIYPQQIDGNFQNPIGLIGSSWTYDDESGVWHFNLEKWLDVVGSVKGGNYLPVSQVHFLDQYQSKWLATLDITFPDDPMLIDLQLENRYAPYLVFPTANASQEFYDNLPASIGDFIQLVNGLQLQQDLEFGNGTSFADADGVKSEGMVVDLLQDVAFQDGFSDFGDTNLYRVPTVFYHLRTAQDVFSNFIQEAGLVKMGPLNEIVVNFSDGSATSAYVKPKILMRRGFSHQGNLVREPGLDAEVVVHEFAHAVFDFYFGSLHQIANNSIRRRMIRGLDEAQAFFLSTSVFGNEQWSEFSYGHWGADRNLNTQISSFTWSLQDNDPFDSDHGLGIWLARLFWQIYTQENLGRSMVYLLFKALGSLASLNISNFSPSGDREAKLKSMLSLLATHIYRSSGFSDQEDFLQQVFDDAGLTISV